MNYPQRNIELVLVKSENTECYEMLLKKCEMRDLRN